MSFVTKMAESFAKGKSHAKRIGLTIFRDQIHEKIGKIHSDSEKKPTLD